MPQNELQKKVIDNAAILALHEAGKGTRAIGAIAGLSHKAIAKRLKSLTPRKTTEIYKELKSDIIAEKQRQLLNMSTGATAKEQRDLAVAWGIYADKELILRGQNPESRPMVIINKISLNTHKRLTQ